MAKKRTPEQEAIRKAMRAKEQPTFISKECFRSRGDKPFTWGFYTNWNTFHLSAGDKPASAKGDYVESPVTIGLCLWPFSMKVFRNNKRIVWIGDWKWKSLLLKTG